ncbi:MAG: glycosyltransferase family 39 protein [Terracidiphilus sp.]|jgi:hypothetical protein
MIRQPGARHRIEIVAQAAIFTLAAVLLFWNIAEHYLWQDEAATAVLAVRMLKFGEPMAYDGKNLITIDMQDDQEDAELSRRTREPQPAIDYFVAQRNFGKDLVWKWQPWGLFAIAAVGIKLLGQTTLGARLPFVLAGLATVPLLYRLARKQFGSFPIAALSALLLVSNSYWILHQRQCRYYPVSSLFLVLTLLAYARWQWGGHNEAWFIVSAWCWFQVDYGTVLPVVAVLFLEAFLAHPHAFWRNLRAGAILAASLAWFVYFYDLLHRGSDTDSTWRERFLQNLFNTNEYVVPALVVLAAVAVLVWKWKRLPEGERRLVIVGCAVILALTLWIPTVTVYSFVRYVIIAAPVGAMLTAWVFVRMLPGKFAWLAAVPAAVTILTPWLGLPLRHLAPPPDWWSGSKLYRAELNDLRAEIFGHWPDPNRLVIEWLRRNAAPTDEILISYEDFPLMYYLPNPIRGGIATFRVEDDARMPPRFVILRRSVDFVHWPVFDREVARYKWEVIPLKAPDVLWGDNPDPMGDDDPNDAPNLYIARRVD